MISAIVFDFGGVLIDWNPYYLFRRFFEDDAQKTARFLAEINFQAWNLQLDQGRVFADVISEVKHRFPAHRALIQAYEERWEETLAGPIQPTVEILHELRQAGHRLYGLTNWSAETFALVRYKYEFFSWFEAIIVSGEEKLAKPDPRIFLVMLKKINQTAGECLFVDDSPANIQAARELGLQTIRFESPEQLRMALIDRGLLGVQVPSTSPKRADGSP